MMAYISDYEVSDSVNVTGTSYMGIVDATYKELVEKFGEPTYVDRGPDKVSTEWNIGFSTVDEEYIVATIYDWKEYDGGIRCRNPMGYNWHIGGVSFDAVEAVNEVLNG